MNTATTRFQIELIQRSASETAARSIDVLNLIDQTLDALGWIANRAEADAKFLIQESEKIRSATPESCIDQNNKMCDTLEMVQSVVEDSYKQFVARRNAAITAPELHPDDGVVEAYTHVIEQLGHLHDALNDLRWAISVHDGLLSPASGMPTDSVDNLFARLLH